MAEKDEQLKKAADLKLWIESRIAELQEEIERLKDALALTDSALRAGSFRPAIEVSESAKEVIAPIPEKREIRRDKSAEVIAYAQVTPKKLVVEPLPEITLTTETPPFKSFLMGKILQGDRTSDDVLMAKGKLKKGEELRFTVDEKDSRILRITIENYRDRQRLADLINTISWTFSKMLEKSTSTSPA